MQHTWESRLASHRDFIVAQLQAAYCGCFSEERCVTCLNSVTRTMAGRVICDYRGVTCTIEQLARVLQQEVSGQRGIPDDMEYAYASKVVSVAKELGPVGREALEVFTGYCEDDLPALREMAADAVQEAHVSLYGSPWQY